MATETKAEKRVRVATARLIANAMRLGKAVGWNTEAFTRENLRAPRLVDDVRYAAWELRHARRALATERRAARKGARR